MLSCFQGILLGWQTKAVETHRVKDIKALKLFIPAVDITGNIAERMAHVQACATWIGKHIQHIIFGFRLIQGYLKYTCSRPFFLPFTLNFSEIVIHFCKYKINAAPTPAIHLKPVKEMLFRRQWNNNKFIAENSFGRQSF